MPVEPAIDPHEAHARVCEPRDFWRQVRRTVDGRPVGEDQIEMIVAAATAGLELRPTDRLLDLCCGNGALTDRLFSVCAGGVGVDASATLISVASECFAREPDRRYVGADVLDHVRDEPAPEEFDKAVCYGSFSYLSDDTAAGMLRTLRHRFTAVERLFLGNLPDRERLHDFYRPADYRPGIERDPRSPLGIWRTRAELDDLATATGWQAEFRRMPDAYYAAHYRYDAVLVPRG